MICLRGLNGLLLCVLVLLFATVKAQNTIRLYKADNAFRNKLLQEGSRITIGFKDRDAKVSGTIEYIDSASFNVRTPGDSIFTVYPDKIDWISVGKNRWGMRVLGSLGPKLIAAGGLYFCFGMVNGYLLGYQAKTILAGRVITGAIISGTGVVITGLYYLIRSRRCKMGEWKMRINNFKRL